MTRIVESLAGPGSGSPQKKIGLIGGQLYSSIAISLLIWSMCGLYEIIASYRGLSSIRFSLIY